MTPAPLRPYSRVATHDGRAVCRVVQAPGCDACGVFGPGSIEQRELVYDCDLKLPKNRTTFRPSTPTLAGPRQKRNRFQKWFPVSDAARPALEAWHTHGPRPRSWLVRCDVLERSRGSGTGAAAAPVRGASRDASHISGNLLAPPLAVAGLQHARTRAPLWPCWQDRDSCTGSAMAAAE